MLNILASLYLSSALAVPAAEGPDVVIMAAKAAAQRVDVYHIYGTTTTEAYSERSVEPLPRPKELPLPDGSTNVRRDLFEDLYDRRVGRTILSRSEPAEQETQPRSTVTRLLDQAAGSVSDLKLRGTCEDFLWLLRPSYRGFDLLDLLESHPDAQLSQRNGLYVVEIPVSALAEYSEFGARLLIAPVRGHAITGIDIYAVADGKEIPLSRCDVELQEVGQVWLPVQARQWERMGAPTQLPRPIRARMIEIEIDWRRSRTNTPLESADLSAERWRQREEGRTPLYNGWTLIRYRPTPVHRPVDHSSERIELTEQPRSRLFVLLTINGIVLIVAGTWWLWLKMRRVV